ncbi:hypothetical protein AVEN_83640-1 [Araneus ventricosus]|uniref:Uncharacterized protein n=1 Tax=Araneus ventricosus TaxID=182803 RepID=A0A4Y2Q383_ARAVE|nr:hypothetical protein AVEN_83640-1 [Araneus ventricosus]
MEEHVFESGKHEITSEHAVLIPALSTVKSLMPYVEAVAVVIGSCHIHSVYEDSDHIKIYLKDKRFVDILVNNGVSILGRQINVDYAVPRADKIILSNVDPVVPDSILMKLLCYYGNPVSAIIHEKIATNSEYSHIECGKRKVYMNIFSDKKIPNKINFTYQDMFFRIDVMVEPPASDVCETLPVPEVTEEQIDEDSNDALEVASSINMKPDVEEVISKKKPSEKRAYHRRGKSKANSATNMASRLKRRARKGWYGTRNAMARNKFTPQNKDKLKLAVKKHLAAEGKRKLRKSEAVPKTEASSRNSAAEENPGSSNNVESKDAIDHFSANDISEYVTQYPLSTNELMEFMKKSKFHRDPCRIAWEFLKEKTPESIEALKIQLREYYQVIKDQGIKFRIRRVIASLKYSKDSVNE